ncbi:MAG: hypothetical protein ACT4P0_03340 [Panacagrimonas sp.]
MTDRVSGIGRRVGPKCAVPLLVAALCPLAGCASFGSQKLQSDPVEYARALNVAQKRETLMNIVSMRFADPPAFLSVSQIIAGYSFDGSASSFFNWATGNSQFTGQVGGNLSYSNRPTFTFTPTTGEALAQSYIRPMSPALILPLAQSGIPIDLLLRIVAQSVGDHQNSAALSGPLSAGNPGFFELLHALRLLQLKGAIQIRYVTDATGGRVHLAVNPRSVADPVVTINAAKVRSLLGISPEVNEVEIVYGHVNPDGRTVGMTTRSVLGILTELGAQIEVPEDDVANGATLSTVRVIGGETRPTIIVHVGTPAPADAYAQVLYGDTQYWISNNDFDSKFAFSVVQNLIALAQTAPSSAAPIVTIPAN